MIATAISIPRAGNANPTVREGHGTKIARTRTAPTLAYTRTAVAGLAEERIARSSSAVELIGVGAATRAIQARKGAPIVHLAEIMASEFPAAAVGRHWALA